MADLVLRIPNGTHLTNSLQYFLSRLSDDIKNKAIRRAVSRTLQTIKAEGGRIARREYTAHPNPMFSVTLHKETLGGEIVFKGRAGYSLFHFKPKPAKVLPSRQNPVGVSTQIRRGGPREVRRVPGFDKPFVMLLSRESGKAGIFVRKSHGHRTKDIQLQFGPSPIQAVIAERNKERMQNKVDETFPSRLQHEINMLITGTIR